jgi:hypothetical protein
MQILAFVAKLAPSLFKELVDRRALALALACLSLRLLLLRWLLLYILRRLLLRLLILRRLRCCGLRWCRMQILAVVSEFARSLFEEDANDGHALPCKSVALPKAALVPLALAVRLKQHSSSGHSCPWDHVVWYNSCRGPGI